MCRLGVIGMNETVKWGYCSSETSERRATSLLALAEMAGMSTGIVTTTRVTHATPASSYAHSADRGWESDGDKMKKALDDASACKDIGKTNKGRDPYYVYLCAISFRSSKKKYAP